MKNDKLKKNDKQRRMKNEEWLINNEQWTMDNEKWQYICILYIKNNCEKRSTYLLSPTSSAIFSDSCFITWMALSFIFLLFSSSSSSHSSSTNNLLNIKIMQFCGSVLF